ncbi:MAG: hypothetical protein PHT37_02340, partial [Candidatus Cloacimonetes bacterium]|nr:hypothetical protein [Candidatus Cloacimonadota bacterium]
STRGDSNIQVNSSRRQLRSESVGKAGKAHFSGFDAEQAVEISQHKPIQLSDTFIGSYHLISIFFKFQTREKVLRNLSLIEFRGKDY